MKPGQGRHNYLPSRRCYIAENQESCMLRYRSGSSLHCSQCILFVTLILAFQLLGGCGSSSSGTPPSSSGSSRPFTSVVFLGDSLTAGFQNGSLLDSQQPNGFANLIAQQAKFSITLPLIAPPRAPAVLELVSAAFPPVIKQSSGITSGRDNADQQATDLAVPGHKLHDLIHS